MKMFRLPKKYYIAAIFTCLCAATAQGQNYGALQHMLQKRPANERFQSNRPNEHLFLSAGVGMNQLLTGGNAQDGSSVSVYLQGGKWFTPIHALRVGINGSTLSSGIYSGKIKMIGGNLDYLLNISSLALGYNDKRRFELLAVAGGEVGYSKVSSVNANAQSGCYYGLYMGLQGNIRLSRTLDFFIEPRIGLYNDAYTHTDTWRNYQQRLAVLAGINYTPAAPMGTRIYFDDFENSRLSDHLFVSVWGGVRMLKSGDVKNSLKGLGPQAAVSLGRWLTPVSGLRLSAGMGYTDAPANSVAGKLKHAELRADYMLNINTLLWGYDADRLFTLSGIIGANLAGTKGVAEGSQWSLGAGAGLQGSFRLNRSVDLFVEPRINLYQKKYAGGNGYFHSDQTGELNFGITYHSVERNARASKHFSKQFADHIFMTSGIGAQLFLNRENLKHASALGPQATISIGKWFSPASGLRLVGSAGFFSNFDRLPADVSGNHLRHINISAGADYLWNLTNTFSGYDPDRLFELIGTAGANLTLASHSQHNLQPGIQVGMQALWHLNDFLGLYIEPQVRMYGDKFIESNLGFIQKDVITGINAGFHYRFAPYSKRNNRLEFDKNQCRNFIMAACGAGSLAAGNKDLINHAGTETRISVGRWFSPISAWRITGSYLCNAQNSSGSDLKYGGISLEYLMSLATLTKGYQANPIFDVLPFIGITGGITQRLDEKKFVPGLEAGAHIRLRLVSNWGLFMEPRIGIRSDLYDGYKQNRADRLASLTAGLSYQF